ncbi:MAG: winged helix DNA-binding domain-containing protein [Bacteroidota bacterium]
MILSEIAKYRLINQQISETKIKSAVEMVQWFGAMQAQEYTQTKWALGLRLPHLKDDDIERNFTEGKIIRIHLLRPTWHFVAAQDIRWMLALTAPRVNAANAYMYRQLELNDTVFNRCNDILIKTLNGGKHLTRDDINKEFEKNKIIAKGHRLSYIMMYAELAGIICSGAKHGTQFTYSLLDERISMTDSLLLDEGLAELTKRYFLSRGPATIKDFSTWSGLKLSDCKKGVEIVKSLLNREVVENQEYFFSSSISIPEKQVPKIYLLPIYDEFIMGYKDRSAITVFKNNSQPTSGFHYDNMIISEGQIIGTWKCATAKKSIDIQFELFKPLNKIQSKAFDNAISRLGEFTNMTDTYKTNRSLKN